MERLFIAVCLISADARIWLEAGLGGARESGDFVEGLKQEAMLRDRMKSAVSLSQLLDSVSSTLDLDSGAVRKPSKSRAPAAARGIIYHLAIFELGDNGSEVGAFLYLGPSGVSLAAKRSEKVLKADPEKLRRIMASIEK